MKHNVTGYTVMILMFLVLLILSGGTVGIISEVLYYSAFALPVILGLLLDKKQRAVESAHDREYKEPKNALRLSREGALIMAPCIFPTVALVFAVSYLTSIVITAATGASDVTDVGDNLILALISHAIVPALLEELLFRYMPQRMLARYSAPVTVILSSVYFALAHVNLFRLPYALLAGAIFMTLNIVCESVLPSVMLHAANNTMSVLFIMYSDRSGFMPIFLTVLLSLTAVSLIIIIIMRKRYMKRLSAVFSHGDRPEGMGSVIAVAVPALFIAFTSLL